MPGSLLSELRPKTNDLRRPQSGDRFIEAKLLNRLIDASGLLPAQKPLRDQQFFPRCVLDGALTAGGTATASVYVWNASTSVWADSGYNISVRDVNQWSVPAAKNVSVFWDAQSAQYIVIAAQC